ncbi:TraR/DksA C4-type zinc finger protein [Streptomyces sp. B1866]|uniref:TraR/DksA C4-type zinc finger protein n=1 Tax=Streptomyces sp. B1866 TaxID=3075431 RepID=UPI0028918874|nr:TraR/DksA C4-type zinc finger protein [Streptomyces sp. B1866]MDT3398768.1 TraR/DksA C4-type zinc finger protein [Streptomyces sp. B1866]
MVARRTAKSTPPPGPTAPGATTGDTAAATGAGPRGGADPDGTAAAPTGQATAHKAGPPEKTTARKAAPAEQAVPAKRTGARKVVAKKTPGTVPAEPQGAATATAVPKARSAAPGELAVRPGEDPWTPEEAAEARAGLDGEVGRLRAEIASAEEALNGLMRDSGDGAGDDQADTGAKNITREHELALASNAREMLLQTERALERLDAGTYGLCENCGRPIGKARMQAFPRATLCVECKQRQERR